MDDTLLKRARAIRLVGLDIDGTLTDGRIIISAKGELAKSFSVHDGQGIRLLIDSGISVAFITARKSRIVSVRARELGIKHVLQGVKDKAGALQDLADELDLARTQIAFMGDDLPDLPAMLLSGLPACVANAAAELKATAVWESSRNGGDGAVREFAEFILQSQNLWESAIVAYTNPSNGNA